MKNKCYEKCKYYGLLHDNYLNIDKHICRHPKSKLGKKDYRVISNIMFKENIVWWCPLEKMEGVNL